MKLIYDVEDKMSFGKMVVFAIQQLLAIMAATLVVPMIIGNGMKSEAALFGAGVGTLVYIAFTKKKSPVFLGSSFAFLGSMAAAFAGGVSMAVGYLGLILGAIFAGLVYVVIAIIVKAVGVDWVNKLMPPVVIGPTVAIIGLSLAGNAIGDLKSGEVFVKEVVDGVALNTQVINDIKAGVAMKEVAGGIEITTQLASPLATILCGLVTLFVTILCSTYGKKTLKLIPFIIGILAGYAVALVMTLIGNAADIDALKVMSFDSLTALFKTADGSFGITLKTFVSVPEFTFMTALGGFSEITGAYIGTVAVAYVPVAFVVFAEHIADHKNISSIIERDLLKEPGLSRTLLGDGVGSMAGAFFGGCPNTTYGESVGCVAITRNASIVTIITAACGAILISFLSPFVAFVNSIPSCVMGGVCMALYGFIAVSGLKMLQKVDLGQNKNLFTASVILIAGIGGLSVSFGKVTLTAVACALILGIIVNIMLSKAKDEETEE
ncbi:MAG: uracil-xanthine permease [Lachnospiraceae bacterium]|nr:uracil-xanthine permease [Lachnospiraceae bacterium]